MSKVLTPSDLVQFSGTEHWYRHPLMTNISYTEGVQFVAETAGAYWLVDKVATLQMLPSIRKEEFQVWKLVDLKGGTDAAHLSCEDGNGNQVYGEVVTFTDFPLQNFPQGFEMWFENNVIYLPGER